MSTTFLLLLVLSLGIVGTSAMEHKIFQPYDGSEVISNDMINGFTRALRRKDIEMLSSLFAETFEMTTCSGKQDKYDILQIVRELPANPDINITYVISKWINGNADISCEVLISGFNVPPFRAVFDIRRDSVVHYLTQGHVKVCPVRRFNTLFY